MNKGITAHLFVRFPFISLSLMLILLALACGNPSSDQKNAADPIDEVKATINIRFDEEQKQLKAVVQFFNDEKPFKIGQQVTLKGSQMVFFDSPIKGPNYSVTREMVYDSLLQLDVGGNQFFIPVPRYSNPKINAEFNKSDGGRIAWDGPLLANGELLAILLQDSASVTVNLNRAGPSTRPSTRIFDHQIDTLSPGPIDLNMVRRIRYNDISGPVNAQISVEYYGLPARFELKP
ncbi:MAG: hypothetical protein AAF705_22255 [Bacteroidota bacterium]